MEPLPISPPSSQDSPPSTSPTITPKTTDKYDEIYAKYSPAIDMGITKNNNELYDHKTTLRTERIDPPEEMLNDDSASYVSGRGRRLSYYSSNTSGYNNNNNNISLSSNSTTSQRDDDTINSSPSLTQFSLRSTSKNSQTTRMIGSSPTQQQRNVINSKLQALNAKSLALRNINYTGVYSSSSSLPYSPTSVMDMPTSILGGESSRQHYSSRQMSHEGDSSVDSRLEYLTKQSLAYRNGTTTHRYCTSSSPASYQHQGNNNSNKKVTFEADYIHDSQGMRMLDDHTTTSNSGYDQVVLPSSSVTSLTSSTTGNSNNKSSKKNSISSLSMKILSEKIINGYTMTRNHCPTCNMALLSNNNKKKKRKSFTFNEDGTLNMDSLRTDNRNEEECVYCPMYKLRTNISKSVCKRVMASKLLSNTNITTSGKICDNCSSPNLINNKLGSTMECQVCPLLDMICVEIIREQSSGGGGLNENTICMDCDCSGATSSETNKCVVCTVLNKELGVSSTTADRSVSSSSLLGASLIPSSSFSAAGQSVYMYPQGSTLSTSGGAAGLLIPKLGGGVGGRQAVDQDIVESTSSTSPGPIDIAKIQEQLNKTIDRMNKIGFASDDIVNLQGQLKDELARAKLSQTELERTLQVPNTSKLSRDELQAELESTKQAQAALEKILVDASKIEKTLSTKQSLKDELLAESYSISQQEVDATGNLKEHVPEPSIFRYDNIPAVVLVYHIPEQDDCDPSVAAQSHHTKNLKRSERDPVVSNSIFDCCGDSSGVVQQQQHQQDFYEYDTIGTDDDDYTHNTVGDDYSRFEMHTSRSGVSQSMHGNESVNDQKRGNSKSDNENCTPKSNTGRCLFSCFDCGGVDDDAYTMVSNRGIVLQPQHQQSQYEQQSPQLRVGGRGDISVGSVSIRKSYFREDSDAYSPVGSEYDESIPASPNISRRPPLPPSLKYSDRFGGSRYVSPTSPTSVISDWSRINEDSAFDSPGRSKTKSSLMPPRFADSPPRSSPYSRFSSTHSVTSELTDFSHHRRVKFGQDSRRNQRGGRKQLSVLSEELSVDGGSFAAVFKETKDTRCGVEMSNAQNGVLIISRIEEDGLFADTKLKVGMKVNYINGECMKGRTCAEAAQLIREKEGQVTINSEDIPRNNVESVAIDSVYSADTDVLLSRLESITSGQRQGRL